jgi:DNA-binding MarR family transcriptional regulator
LIDRLEQKGYARRERHPHDGRRILIRADDARVYAAIAPLFADWVRSLEELYAGYSDDELRTILDFMTKVAERQRAAIEQLPNQ